MGISYKEDAVLDLIASAYDAALGPERWPGFLASLADSVGATAAFFCLTDDRTGDVGFCYDFGIDPTSARAYAHRFAALDPWLRASSGLAEEAVVSGQSLIAHAALAKTEFYTKWLKPQNLHHALCAVVRKQAGMTARLVLARPKAAGPFRPAARAFLRKLVPQLRRALSIHERFATLDLTRVAFGDTLDCLEVGVVLIDRNGRPYFMNRRAEALIGQQDGLLLNGAEIATSAAKETAEMRDLIRSALAGNGGGEREAAGSMTVSRPSHKRPYSILVTPVCVNGAATALATGAARSGVAMLISDPEHRLALDANEVARHYGLTRAEAAVLVGLANGSSLSEIAADRRISKNTVRSHLQRIFDKTDTSRQAELVKIVLSGPAAVGVAGGHEGSGT